MKGLFRLLLAATALLAIACDDDEPAGKLTLGRPAVYLTAGGTATVGFNASANIAKYYVTGTPEGWEEPVVDASARTVTVKAPSKIEEGTPRTAEFTLTGTVRGGKAGQAKLFAAVSGERNFADRANCHIVSEADTHYTFDAKRRPDGTPIATASLDILWQTGSDLLKHLSLDGDRASFFIASDSEGELREGNALVGAYDASGALLWSWHIWIAGFDPEADAVDFGGYRMMNRNLGALDNANASHDEITDSYGLYYQWGRKDPFIGPDAYNAPSGEGAALYDGRNRRVYLSFEPSTAETGTGEYARLHPMTFLLGEKPSSDWLAAESSAGWSDRKSVEDPCPAGWRVAPAAAYGSASIVEDPASGDFAQKWGWTLANGNGRSFFLGAGYRTYLDGKINLVYDNLPVGRNAAVDMQPWTGYYWTSAADGKQARALYFWFNKSNPAASGIRSDEAVGRANGLQVRCVRE